MQQSNRNDFTKAVVRGILQHPEPFEWTLQGFGMLRTYIGSDEWRLNVWNDQYAVPNVSTIHTHPWHFESLVVAGVVNNIRLQVDENGNPYKYVEMTPGMGFAGFQTEAKLTALAVTKMELVKEGHIYSQQAEEIHSSMPVPGTVTLNKRQRVGEDKATVYWEADSEWVSAKPRLATPEEVKAICEHALEAWF